MRTHKLKILLMGDAGVGKTSLIQKFVKGVFLKEYKMTVGCDLFMKDIYFNNDQDLVTLSIWDIAGQDRFQYFRSAFYKDAVGALVVFDLTRYETFTPSVIKWIRELWGFTGRIPIVLLGNKIDLVNMRIIRTNDAKFFADKVPCTYIETSAKEGQGVEEAFMKLAEKSFEYWQKTNKSNL